VAILVTGGTGYIGSHTVVHLLENGFEVIILDNLVNSSVKVLKRIEKITNRLPVFIEGDVRDRLLLRKIFSLHPIDSIIHFAGLKSVAESSDYPLKYYDNNVTGTITLLEEMVRIGLKKIVFSSSATVYGAPIFLPYTESHPLNPINVYGQTKLMSEKILGDLNSSDPSFSAAILRYFNPVGAHKTGLIGENPNGEPNNLMPYITQVAVGKKDKLLVYGDDYETIDGTGRRDYIHVMDLASGHLAALKHISKTSGLCIANLGTGKSTSVLELVSAFERNAQKSIPYEVRARRLGDLPEYYADSSYAEELFQWVCKYNIDEMCQDSWRWQFKNPKGY
jgi:UDP-glucose 4-epimerase